MKIKLLITALSIGLLSVSLPTIAAIDIDACDECHGKNGISTDSEIPSIAGFSETSLQDQLFAYIDGRPSEDMAESVDGMSDEDVEAYATHYSELDFVPATQTFDEAKAALGKKVHDKLCEKCHSEGGSLADDDASILAGQWMPYLKHAFAVYLDGSRQGEEKMDKAFKQLKPKHIEALAHYYASGQ